MTAAESDPELFWIQYVIIPIVAAGIAALSSLIWLHIRDWHRRRQFQNLIERELEEIGPNENYWEDTSIPKEQKKLCEHFKGEFIHQRLLREPSENRDFILSLNPELVYHLSQLWHSFDNNDKCQWVYYLCNLCFKHYPHNSNIKVEVYEKWVKYLEPKNECRCDEDPQRKKDNNGKS